MPEVEQESTQTSKNLQNANKILTKQSLRKTSLLWNYINYETKNNLEIPIYKKCKFVFSNKSGNFSIECHLFS